MLGPRAHPPPASNLTQMKRKAALGRLKLLRCLKLILSFASFLSGRYAERWVGLVAGGGWHLGSEIVEKPWCSLKDFDDYFEGSRSEVVLGGSWEASGGLSGEGSGPSWEPLGRLLGAFGAVLGALGAVLRTPWAVLGASWAVLGASWAVLEPLGPSLGRQEAPRGLQDTPRRLRDAPDTPKIINFLHVFARFHTFPKFQPRNGVQNRVQTWGPNMGSNMGSKMGTRNGVQHGVQNGIQKWGPNWGP